MTIKKRTIATIVTVIVVISAIFILNNIKSPDSKKAGTFSFPTIDNTDDLKLNVIENNGHWGYEIYVNNERFILQETIPGVAGNQKFKKKNDAKNCGELVIKKLKQQKIPSISMNELDSLSIDIN
ncbi:MAG: DUF4907 domain-containing protein [Prolixibacteraceae bacterium]|nr:DUF4907 domain-containing protein [Prolixibacteraceae bacterium]